MRKFLSFVICKNFGRASRSESLRLSVGGGFTLLESLVAISILSVALGAVMSLATQSIKIVPESRDRITATLLAQEGLEIIRNKRDSNILAINNGPTLFPENWLDGLGSCVAPKHCYGVVNKSTGSTIFNECASPCTPLRRSSDDYYNYAGTSTQTPFTREMWIEPVGVDDVEIRVHAIVSWASRTGTQSVRFDTELFRRL